MQLIDQILSEAQQEATITRRLFQRVPSDKLSWRPHAKAYSLGQLASHVAAIPGQVAALALRDGVDLPLPALSEAGTKAEIIDGFEAGMASAATILASFGDTQAVAPWVVRKAGQVVMTLPRIALLRTFLLNHSYHHRGQLALYLRILDVPVPSVYGPSGDEDPFA